jgi:prepilin-type N-terminal cleavage/methylation domain-containing protein
MARRLTPLLAKRWLQGFRQARSAGFSLTELMISLAIVGVVATLTLPNLNNNMQAAQRQAVVRETVQAIANVVKQGVDSGDLDSGVDVELYMVKHLNGTKECIDGTSHCTQYLDDNTTMATFPTKGVVLPNGAQVDFLEVSPTYSLAYIDWDGAKGAETTSNTNPNVIDVLFVCFNPTSEVLLNHHCSPGNTGSLQPGAISAHYAHPFNAASYNQVMGLS